MWRFFNVVGILILLKNVLYFMNFLVGVFLSINCIKILYVIFLLWVKWWIFFFKVVNLLWIVCVFVNLLFLNFKFESNVLVLIIVFICGVMICFFIEV